jgi:ABC transport system ATP-binding/permease protein
MPALPGLRVRVDTCTHDFRPGTTVTIGRDPGSCVVLSDERVSRHHLSIAVENDAWVLTHLSRSNPTFVDGQPIGRLCIAGRLLLNVSVQESGPQIVIDLVTAPEDALVSEPVPDEASSA